MKNVGETRAPLRRALSMSSCTFARARRQASSWLLSRGGRASCAATASKSPRLSAGPRFISASCACQYSPGNLVRVLRQLGSAPRILIAGERTVAEYITQPVAEAIAQIAR